VVQEVANLTNLSRPELQIDALANFMAMSPRYFFLAAFMNKLA